ncbi:hypothetical protein [Bartonella sp. CB169]|uniref:hypothetical protein n=1 Tax=Bartonella sp. CB169 TaxID=3112257 RepID=UPI00300E550C
MNFFLKKVLPHVAYMYLDNRLASVRDLIYFRDFLSKMLGISFHVVEKEKKIWGFKKQLLLLVLFLKKITESSSDYQWRYFRGMIAKKCTKNHPRMFDIYLNAKKELALLVKRIIEGI